MLQPAVPPEGGVLRPPLKWAGGKRWQLSVLAPLWKPHANRRLVEPFCGGLSVALGLQPELALLNDANTHLVNFYRWVQRGLRISIRVANDAEVFYRHRARFNTLIREGNAESREAAELFYFLNRTAYNGLCRFNSRGEFNAPFGRYKAINYALDFMEYRSVLGQWQFLSMDFADLPFDRKDFIYADPPYDVDFTTYAQGGFGWDDQVRTAELLAEHRGPVILVNQATKRIDALYRRLGFAVDYLNAPRRISCTGDRTPAKEILATRNL
jgi:DNA adenine methylase